ncbi:MAG: organic solvent tolerance protein OstA [Spirochaetia bacterium]|nr:organic solvent tolerance protein OstA [Spirochaetia bacterium]
MLNKLKSKIAFFSLLTLITLPLSAEKILFSANRMTGQAGNTNTTTTLSGNAYIKTDSMEIQADNVELSGDNYRYIKSTGNISGNNTEAHIEFTCDSLEYDRTTKIALLKGNVKLIDKDNDVTANAQIIEYNQDSEIAILQIQINLMQKENVCSGSYAVYYKDTQLLEISGNAQVKQKEDVFRAQYITLDMNTQDITLGGNVKGKVTDTKEPESAENSPEANMPEGLPPEAEAAETAVMQENEENDDGE